MSRRAGLASEHGSSFVLEVIDLSVLIRGCKVALITACSWTKLTLAKEGLAGCQGHSHEIAPMCKIAQPRVQ